MLFCRSERASCVRARPDHDHHLAALEGAPVGLLTFDSALRIRFRNRRLAELLAVSAADADGCIFLRDLLERSVLFDRPTARRLHDMCVQAVVRSGNDDHAREDTFVAGSASATPHHIHVATRDLDDGHVLACFRDVTGHLAAATASVALAMTDPLTGLPNRKLFGDRVEAALAGGAQGAPDATSGGTAVLLIDLDRFKPVNDTLGHLVGDGLLRLVAARLRTVVRDADIVARLGGDEFAVLLSPIADADVLRPLAARIVDVLGRPYLVDGHLVNVSASLGFALSPADGAVHDQLLRSADLALYDAKSAGRGRFAAFRPELDRRALARRSMEIDLRKALALHEFELHYQPQIDIETETVTGFEALLRWRNPTRGLVSPLDFIPLAEEIGLIVPLGEWVLREACREAVRWPSAISLAVNVSPSQFENGRRLLDAVSAALTSSGLSARRLEIEITETVLLRNETSVLDTLHSLRALGIKVAMDDFGTGYSSLSQLRSFPFDKIKIDRSFVGDGDALESQNAIIRAITALGTSLGMATIAEGVETQEQLARIRAEGCRSVQGYLFSRPVPTGDIAPLIASFGRRRSAPATVIQREEISACA